VSIPFGEGEPEERFVMANPSLAMVAHRGLAIAERVAVVVIVGMAAVAILRFAGRSWRQAMPAKRRLPIRPRVAPFRDGTTDLPSSVVFLPLSQAVAAAGFRLQRAGICRLRRVFPERL
jgi:hypothetical protein